MAFGHVFELLVAVYERRGVMLAHSVRCTDGFSSLLFAHSYIHFMADVEKLGERY